MSIKLVDSYVKYKLRMQMILINSLLAVLPLIIFGSIFFSISLNNSKTSISNTMNLLFKQVNGRVSEYFSTIDQLTQTMTYNIRLQNLLIGSDKNNPENKKEINQYFQLYKDINNSITDILFVELSENVFTNKDNGFILPWQIINQTNSTLVNEELRNYITNLINTEITNQTIINGKMHIYGIYRDNVIQKDYFLGIRVMKSITNENAPYEPKGIFIFMLDKKILSSIIDNNDMPVSTAIAIIDPNESIIASSGGTNVFETGNYDLIMHDKTLKWNKINNELYMIETAPLLNTNWKIVAQISDKEFIKETTILRNLLIFIIFILVIITILSTMILNIKITQPLKKLVDVFDKVAVGNFKVKLNFKTKNEVTSIADSFNKMVSDLDNLTHNIFNTQQRLFETEIQKNQFKLNGLQSQISSHFLYNTLSCIRGMARKNAYEDINTVIKNLVAYFRYNSKGSEYVTLNDEILHLENYFAIQKMRFGDRFKFVYEISDDLKNQEMIKLSLQPIVENVFLHGFDNKHGKGIVKIKVEKESDKVIVKVYDNGSGMTEETIKTLKTSLITTGLEEITESHSIGIVNIQQRTKLYYGNEFGVTIKSWEGIGTVFILSLPYKIIEGN